MGNQAYVPSDFDATGESSSYAQNNSNNSAPPPARPSPPQYTAPTNNGIFSIGFYAQYFDVDTRQVISRCMLALNPFGKQLFLDEQDDEEGNIGDGVIGGRPDLYGPFWICTTVILVLFFASTLVGLLFSSWQGVKYEYQFDLLTGAAGLMYSYTFLVPLGLWVVMRYFDVKSVTSLLQIVSLYGYSNITWIPVAILSVSPLLGVPSVSNVIRWIFIGLGFVFSASFIVKNLAKRMINGTNSKRVVYNVLAVVVILHVGLAIAVKFLFFGGVKIEKT